MTIFPLELIRLPGMIAGNFRRWIDGSPGADLQDLSDKAMEDIGLVEPPKRDLEAVKPFWMP